MCKHAYVYAYVCHMMHMWIYMCIKESALYWKSPSTLHYFCSVLQKQSAWYNWYWGTYATMAPSPLCQILYISCIFVLLLLFFAQVFCTWTVCHLAINIVSLSLSKRWIWLFSTSILQWFSSATHSRHMCIYKERDTNLAAFLNEMIHCLP